jgi:hypothetical protein
MDNIGDRASGMGQCRHQPAIVSGFRWSNDKGLFVHRLVGCPRADACHLIAALLQCLGKRLTQTLFISKDEPVMCRRLWRRWGKRLRLPFHLVEPIAPAFTLLLNGSPLGGADFNPCNGKEEFACLIEKLDVTNGGARQAQMTPPGCPCHWLVAAYSAQPTDQCRLGTGRLKRCDNCQTAFKHSWVYSIAC